MNFLGFLGKPLGIAMSWIYNLVPNYFITIFLFTFAIRVLLFPVFLKQQKSAMDRARLAPALERIQKKYANDRNKLMEKQQALYEKHGVSMTGGCLPMLLSMVVLFGVIAAIYAPLSNLSNPSMSDQVIAVAQYAIIGEGEGKLTENDLKGYYGELRLMTNAEKGTNKDDIIAELNDPSAAALQRAYSKVEIIKNGTINEENYTLYKTYFAEQQMNGRSGEELYGQIVEMKEQFSIMNGKFSLLDQPWNKDKGMKSISWIWLIPLISGLTSFVVSYVSMSFSKRSMPQNQPGQGCTNNMMLIYMPVFSTWIAFTVPGAVGVYWIFSNILSVAQTIIMNKIYDPAKARAEAEAAYQERRRQKEEDKKRLAKARQREEALARQEEQEKERQREASREMNKKKKKGQATTKTTENEDAVVENSSDEE